MPLSNRIFDQQVEDFLKENLGKKYFDIGAGAGKYGKMIRKVNPKAYIVGIEAEKDYIEKYETKKNYDKLINGRIENFIQESPRFTTDIAIMGDLIEHLFKSDGINLIHYLMYRCKLIILVFPSMFVMYDVKGYKTEAHNSIWVEEDFKQFDYQFFQKGHMNLVIIKGYYSNSETIFNLN